MSDPPDEAERMVPRDLPPEVDARNYHGGFHQPPGAHADAAIPADRAEIDMLAAEPMLQWFEFSHLPAHLQEVSETFFTLARHLVLTLPRNPERTVALRKLIEAKDCAVRAVLTR